MLGGLKRKEERTSYLSALPKLATRLRSKLLYLALLLLFLKLLLLLLNSPARDRSATILVPCSSVPTEVEVPDEGLTCFTPPKI